jgi:hypothetical protein
MDSLSKVSEPLPDVAVAVQTREGRWQARGRPKEAARRRPKKGKPEPATASGDRRESHAEEDGGLLSQSDSDKKTPADQEVPGACYGRDKAIAPTLPSKGRLIDIAV